MERMELQLMNFTLYNKTLAFWSPEVRKLLCGFYMTSHELGLLDLDCNKFTYI